MARPIPIIVAVPDITVLPAVATVLDGTTSIPSGGATIITEWLWTLVEKPVGSTATLTDATTSSATLNNVDIAGNYVVFLRVTDDAGRRSFTTPYARQHLPPEDLVTFDVVLYAFESPVVTAFEVVNAPYTAIAARLNQSLYLTAKKEYGWLVSGLWPLTTLLHAIREEVLEVYDRPNKKLLADAVAPQTSGAGVTVDGLIIRDTGAVTALDSNRTSFAILDPVAVTGNLSTTADLTVGGIADVATRVVTPVLRSTGAIIVESLAGNATFGAAGGTATLRSTTGSVAVTAQTSVAIDAVTTAALNAGTVLNLTAAAGAVNTTASTDVNITATTGSVEVTAQDAVNLTAWTDDITIRAEDGDVTVVAQTDIDLVAGASITLTPTTSTTTTKPLFAPGLVHGRAESVVAAGFGLTKTLLAEFVLNHFPVHSVATLKCVGRTVNDLISAAALVTVEVSNIPDGVFLSQQVLTLGPSADKSTARFAIEATLAHRATTASVLQHSTIERVIAGTLAGVATRVDDLVVPSSPYSSTDVVTIRVWVTPHASSAWGAGASVSCVTELVTTQPTAEAVL